jgi:hypothetical protein
VDPDGQGEQVVVRVTAAQAKRLDELAAMLCGKRSDAVRWAIDNAPDPGGRTE